MERNDYCKCKELKSVTTGFEDDFGYWDVCCECGKKSRTDIIITTIMMERIMKSCGNVGICIRDEFRLSYQLDAINIESDVV